MAELLHDYFTPGWHTRPFECPCGWQGDSRGMAMELHEAVADFACPQCGNLLLIVAHPSLEQVRRAAADGNPEAMAQLAIIEEAQQRFPPGTG